MGLKGLEKPLRITVADPEGSGIVSAIKFQTRIGSTTRNF
jgi:hypothetical protein